MSVDGDWRAPIPRQEFVELAHRVTAGYALEHVLEIGEGLDIVELGGGDERANGRSALGVAGSGEQVVLAADRDGRIARSTVLLSSSMRPSWRKRQRASQRVSA